MVGKRWSEIESREIEMQLLPACMGTGNRRPNGEAPVAHVREHMHRFDFGQHPDQPRRLDIGRDATGNREPRLTGSSDSVPRQFHADSFNHALGHGPRTAHSQSASGRAAALELVLRLNTRTERVRPAP